MSDLAARREARRRRILENADSRLKKITNSDVASEVEFSTSNITVNYAKQNLRSEQESQNDTTSNSTAKNITTNNDKSFADLFQNSIPESPGSSVDIDFAGYKEGKVALRIWFIISLAVVVRYLLLLFEQLQHLIAKEFFDQLCLNNIFIPFFIYEATEYTLFKPNIPDSGILNLVFMLNPNVDANHIRKILVAFRTTMQVLQDLLLYFFAFVCFDLVVNFITLEWN